MATKRKRVRVAFSRFHLLYRTTFFCALNSSALPRLGGCSYSMVVVRILGYARCFDHGVATL